MRFSLGPALALLGAVAGCGAPPAAEERYVADRAFRRAALEASLWSPANSYSQVRLARYAVDAGGWELLPEWNPPTQVVAQPLAQPDAPLAPEAAALPLDIAATDEAGLLALGEAAFFRYPVQLFPSAVLALASPEAAARYGLWVDSERGLGGFARVALADGSVGIAYTCATCHASPRDGALEVGLGNERLDLGRLLADAGRASDPEVEAALRAWGPGRLDVTTTTGREPVRIPDLRAVRWLGHLHADATVLQRDRISLAIRLETLIITSHGEALRPPRMVTLALAAWVWSLAASLPPEPDPSARGAALFASRCAGCHAPPALTGPPVPLAEIGTDATLGRSLERGTGLYRVPSLHGVGARRLLMHDGAVGSLAAMFDPTRLDGAYQGGVRPGAVPGHVFGLDLDAAARAELIAYLERL